MSDNDDSLYGDAVYEGGVEDADDPDPAEQLTGEDLEEPYDTGYSPPERPPAATRYGTTDLEQAEGESLDQRLAEEEPDIDHDQDGRLVAPDEGAHADLEKDEVAYDVGRAGSAASAEEAAVHVVDEDEAFDAVIESDSVDD
jgi:hypothetical protein